MTTFAIHPSAVIRHAAPTVVEATVVPMALYHAGLAWAGLSCAMWLTLAWMAANVIRHAASGHRIPATTTIAGTELSAKLAILLVGGAHAATTFFSFPVVFTLLTAAAFAVSTITARPLTAPLAANYLPLPTSAWQLPQVRMLCRRASAVWAVALGANAVLTLWLLHSYGPTMYVNAKAVVALTTTAPAIGLTAWIFHPLFHTDLSDLTVPPLDLSALSQ